jgi:hypothetical protein
MGRALRPFRFAVFLAGCGIVAGYRLDTCATNPAWAQPPMQPRRAVSRNGRGVLRVESATERSAAGRRRAARSRCWMLVPCDLHAWDRIERVTPCQLSFLVRGLRFLYVGWRRASYPTESISRARVATSSEVAVAQQFARRDIRELQGRHRAVVRCRRQEWLHTGRSDSGRDATQMGNYELAGNVTEWNVDVVTDLPVPCDDCVNRDPSGRRHQSNGSFQRSATHWQTPSTIRISTTSSETGTVPVVYVIWTDPPSSQSAPHDVAS